MKMLKLPESLQRLAFILDTVPAKLSGLDKYEFERKPAPHKWSKKEILGHLIDSAANNHQRFIRAKYEDIPSISYDPDQWVALNHWQDAAPEQLIQFWTLYNRQILEVLKRTADGMLEKKCNTGGAENHTLEFLATDYVEHMEHHLREIVEY